MSSTATSLLSSASESAFTVSPGLLSLTSGATLYHGDLDFDDDVDMFDLMILLGDPDLPGPCSASSP